MSTLPDRLREERNRLGLTQAEFGKIGGVQKQAQLLYEAGKRTPDAEYLSNIASAGCDVGYVVTGTRTPIEQITSGTQCIENHGVIYTVRHGNHLQMVGEPGITAQGTGIEPEELTAREVELIDHVRACQDQDKAAIERLAYLAMVAQVALKTRRGEVK